jgi:hypothetical protein
MDNKGKDPRNPLKFNGLVNLSRKPPSAGEKEKSADDFSAFERPRRVGRIKQGDVPETSKTKSKLIADSRRKLSNANKHHKGNRRKWSALVHRRTDVEVMPGPRKFKRRNRIAVREGFKKLTRLSVTQRHQSEERR